MWDEKWNAAFESRNPQTARKVLQEITNAVEYSNDPEQKASFLLAAAGCNAILKNYEQMRSCLESARRIAPGGNPFFDVDADFLEALWYTNQGYFEEGLSRLDQVLKNYGEDLKRVHFRSLYEQVQFARALALTELEKFDQACPTLEEARSFDLSESDQAILQFQLGVCYLASNNNEAALNCFRRAAEIGVEPTHEAALHYYLGRVYYRLKDYGNAKKDLLASEECIKRGLPGPAPGDLYKLLAYSCMGLREKSEAEMYSRLATAV